MTQDMTPASHPRCKDYTSFRGPPQNTRFRISEKELSAAGSLQVAPPPPAPNLGHPGARPCVPRAEDQD